MQNRLHLFTSFRLQFLMVLGWITIGIPSIAAGGLDDSLKIVVLGSSTAEGVGASKPENSWVNKYRFWVQSRWKNAELINLAKGGYTTYDLMPDTYTPPDGRRAPDPQRNITKALSLNPSAIIINMPSNDAANDYPVYEQLTNYDTLRNLAAQAGIPLWVATTQPRNLTISQRQMQKDMRDSTFSWFGDKALDFWYGLAEEDGTIKKEFDSGDGIHLNDKGHEFLFNRAKEGGAGLPAYQIQLKSPAGNGPFFGVLNIKWASDVKTDPARQFTFFISRDDGKNWQPMTVESQTDSSAEWNTANFPDGLHNLIRLIAIGDSGYATVKTGASFIIDNPIDSPPEGFFLSPREGDELSGITSIRWHAEDVETSDLLVDFESSTDGVNWEKIAQFVLNNGLFEWNTEPMANSDRYQLRMQLFDGLQSVYVLSSLFGIRNEGNYLSGIQQVSGTGGGEVTVRIANPLALTGHTYHVVFDDTTANELIYHLDDKTTGVRELTGIGETDGSTESPLVDGLRLRVKNFSEAVPNSSVSGWETGSSPLNVLFYLWSGKVGGKTITGYPQPADYRVDLFSEVVGQTSTLFGSPAGPVTFTVTNLTENKNVPVLFNDLDRSGFLSRNDQVFFVEPDSAGADRITWAMFLSGDVSDAPPQPGDVFRFFTKKPFRSGDVFEFTSIFTHAGDEHDLHPLTLRLLNNFPNPFNPSTRIQWVQNEVTSIEVSVTNVLGQVVKTISLKGTTGSNVASVDFSGLASGLYFISLSNVEQKSNLLKVTFMK